MRDRGGLARAVVLAISVVAVAGCNATPSESAATGASGGASDLVGDWQHTLDQGTARLSLSGEAVGVLQGDIDFKHNELDLTTSGAGAGTVEIRDVGGYTYTLVPGDAAAAASLIASPPSQPNEPGPSVDLGPQQWSKTKNRPGERPLATVGILGILVSTTQILAAYVKNAERQDLGAATVLGISTTHYRLTKTAQLPAHTFPGHGSIAAGTVSTLTLDIYVSSDNLVRRISYQGSIAPGPASSSSPTASALGTQTLDLSDFGVPFTVSAPPPADVASG